MDTKPSCYPRLPQSRILFHAIRFVDGFQNILFMERFADLIHRSNSILPASVLRFLTKFRLLTFSFSASRSAVPHTWHETAPSRIPFHRLTPPKASLLPPHRAIHRKPSAYSGLPMPLCPLLAKNIRSKGSPFQVLHNSGNLKYHRSPMFTLIVTAICKYSNEYLFTHYISLFSKMGNPNLGLPI